MTRGRYAKRADNRRDRESLVSEAEEARQTAARLESDTKKKISVLEAQVASLSMDLAAARRLMDEGSSPAVIQLRSQLQAAREKVAARDRDVKLLRSMFARFRRRLTLLLARNFELPENEAASLISETVSLTAGTNNDDLLRMHRLLDGGDGAKGEGSATVRAVERGRISPEHADVIAAVRTGNQAFKGSRRGDRDSAFGDMWATTDDEFALFLVAKEAADEPEVVAIYDNGDAARKHAEIAGLEVLRWRHLSEYQPAVDLGPVKPGREAVSTDTNGATPA